MTYLPTGGWFGVLQVLEHMDGTTEGGEVVPPLPVHQVWVQQAPHVLCLYLCMDQVTVGQYIDEDREEICKKTPFNSVIIRILWDSKLYKFCWTLLPVPKNVEITA